MLIGWKSRRRRRSRGRGGSPEPTHGDRLLVEIDSVLIFQIADCQKPTIEVV